MQPDKSPNAETDLTATENAVNNSPEPAENERSEAPSEAAPPEPASTKEESADSKARDAWEKLLRTTADFENFKKRAARERQEAVKYANVGLLEKLIPVLDSFDMALAATQEAQAQSVDALKQGIQMIHQQLRGALAEAGLSEVDATGQVFDPTLHEAISQSESTEVPEGHVLHQVRKGYKLRDRLLRPASVVVAKQPDQ